MLEVSTTCYTYVNRHNQVTWRFSNYRKISNLKLEENKEDVGKSDSEK